VQDLHCNYVGKVGIVSGGGLRALISEGLMRLAVWVDPGGHRTGRDGEFEPRLGPVEEPYSDPEGLRPAVPPARHPGEGSGGHRPGRVMETPPRPPSGGGAGSQGNGVHGD
jgi:hypothetical protein